MWSEVFLNFVNIGIYIIELEIFDYIEDGNFYDFSKDLFLKFLKEKVFMFGFKMDGYWCDIGDVGSYIKVYRDVFRLGGIFDFDLKSFIIFREFNILLNVKIS